MTAKELVDALATADTYTYTYAGKTTDSDNEVLKELYVTVTAATASNGNNNQNTNTEAGTATVDYTVASNGTLRYKLNYTAPSYVADNATVKFDLDVYASGKFYDTISYQNGKKLSAGEFTVTDRAFGYPDDEELTFEMSNISFSAVKVEYKGTGAKVTGQDKTLTVGTDTLDFTLDTTATSGTVNYTVTQGKNTLKTGSIDLAASKVVSASGLTITDDAAVVVTIEGMDKLAETYKVTVPATVGKVTLAASKTSGITAGEGISITASTSDTSVYGYLVKIAGVGEKLVQSGTPATFVITVNSDVEIKASDVTVTEIAKLTVDTTSDAAKKAYSGNTITLTFNRDVDAATVSGIVVKDATNGAVTANAAVSGNVVTLTVVGTAAADWTVEVPTTVADAAYADNTIGTAATLTLVAKA